MPFKISVSNVILSSMPYLITVAYFNLFISVMDLVRLIWFAVIQCAYIEFLPRVNLPKYFIRSAWTILQSITFINVPVGTSDGQ